MADSLWIWETRRQLFGIIGLEDVILAEQGKDESIARAGAPNEAAAESDASLGTYLVDIRKSRGLSQEQVVAQSRIPANYIRMLENSEYSLVSDQLYLLPFVRKYASFLGLDAEEMALRFIQEVQRADTSAARMAEPFEMVTRDLRRGRRSRLFFAIPIAAIVLLIALYTVSRYVHERRTALPHHTAAVTSMINSDGTITTTSTPPAPAKQASPGTLPPG